jgi:hypothetical protein
MDSYKNGNEDLHNATKEIHVLPLGAKLWMIKLQEYEDHKNECVDVVSYCLCTNWLITLISYIHPQHYVCAHVLPEYRLD